MKTQVKMIAVLALLCAPMWAQEEWTVTELPSSVCEHAMIRDVANDRLIVFGGYHNGVLSNHVWEYDSVWREWRKLRPEGTPPSPRREPVAAYDANGGRMIVFGGTASTGYTNDTFALDLTPGAESWVELAPADPDKPLGRTHGNLIVDTLHNRAVLYGGYRSPTMLRDAWALDLTACEDWQLLATVNHPTGNSFGNAAIYDPIGQRMLVYRAYQSQLVALSLDADLIWTNHTNGTTPAQGRYAAAAYDSIRHEMILQGGLKSGLSSSETHRVNLDTMEFTRLPEEPGNGRFWHAAAYDEARDRFMVVGGRAYPSQPYATMGTLALLPGAPEDLAPDEEEVTGDEVILSWSDSVGIRDGRYVVEVYLQEPRALISQDNVMVLGNTAVFIPDAPADGVEGETRTYVWQVMAINDNGSSEYSALATFQHVYVVGGDDGDGVVASLGDSSDSAAIFDVVLGTEDEQSGADQSVLTVEDEPSRTTIVGGGSGEPRAINGAGCTGSNGGHGLAVAILLIGVAGAAVRRLRRVRN